MHQKMKKATFSLNSNVLAALDEAVARGLAPGKSVLVERAIVKELNELKRQERQARRREAAKDPLFIKDIEDLEIAF